MGRKNPNLPTDAELEILAILWERGPSSVREVFKVMQTLKEIGYTTVLKLMQIMTDKGLVVRDQSVRPQIFTAASAQGVIQKNLVGKLLDGAFKGSTGNLILHALSTHSSTAEERNLIRDLLDRLEEDSK